MKFKKYLTEVKKFKEKDVIEVKATRKSIYSHHGINPSEKQSKKKLQITKDLGNNKYSVKILGTKVRVGGTTITRPGMLELRNDNTGTLRSETGKPVKFDVEL